MLAVQVSGVRAVQVAEEELLVRYRLMLIGVPVEQTELLAPLLVMLEIQEIRALLEVLEQQGIPE